MHAIDRAPPQSLTTPGCVGVMARLKTRLHEAAMADDIIAMRPRCVVFVGFFCLLPSHQHTQLSGVGKRCCARAGSFLVTRKQATPGPACAFLLYFFLALIAPLYKYKRRFNFPLLVVAVAPDGALRSNSGARINTRAVLSQTRR